MAVKVPTLVLALTDRKPSSFVLVGTENSESPERLDVSSNYILLNESFLLVPTGKKDEPPKQVKARWISGVETILVDKQDEMGIKPNPIRDIIEFINGSFTVRREGATVGLYDFLKSYDGNESNKNRPEGSPTYFKEITTSDLAEKEIVDIPEQAKALTFISSLMMANRQGSTNRYTYKTDKIDWLCKLFSINTVDFSDQEKVQKLTEKANEDPTFFNLQVEDASGELKVIIKMAKELGIISLDTDSASMVENGEIITKLRGKSMNDKIDEVVEFLKSPDGDMLNSVIRTKVEYSKTQLSDQKK